MKKFNPEKELVKVQKDKKISSNSSKLSNMYVPLLVVACSCLAMVGVAFSSKLVDDSKRTFTITVDVLGAEDYTYTKEIKEGEAFSDSIPGTGTFGSLNCFGGKMAYDPLTYKISSEYINDDVSCVLSFMDDGIKNITVADLDDINDGQGISYYYKANADNNYVVINDMLFRIVRINGDGSFRLAYSELLPVSTFGTTNNYDDSNIKVALNNWYNANLKSVKYVTKNYFDASNYEDFGLEEIIPWGARIYSEVGTLSVKEVALMTENVEGKHFLNNSGDIYLMNGSTFNTVFAYQGGKIERVNPDTQLYVRPVINVSGVELVGQGTEDWPYTIEE